MSLIDINKLINDIIYDKCRTCKHFLSHYTFAGSAFNKVTHSCAIKYNYVDPCEDWMPRDEIISRQKEEVKNILCEMREKLTVIETIFAEENKSIPN